MNSNNESTKSTTELDIRDIANFLLSKLWIIALVVLSFAIIAFLWTTFFVDKQYASTTEMFIISVGKTETNQANGQTTNDWAIGKQLTRTSGELIMGDYCDWVAQRLNEHDPSKSVPEGQFDLSTVLNNEKTSANKENTILMDRQSFSQFYQTIYGNDQKITGSFIRKCITVSSDDETCIVSVKATTIDQRLSAAISNAVMCLFDEYINEFMQVESIRTTISSSGSVPSSPSNANATRNAILFGAIGAVLVCAVLIIIFIFDDKIKTPDDIERQLKLSVLGTIPEIEEA